MKVKNYHAEKLIEIIGKVENDASLTKKVSLKFMNLKDALAPTVKNYTKVKDELIMKYGQKTDRGFEIPIASPNFLEFNKEIEPIANDIVDISFIPLTIDDIPDEVKIISNDLKLIDLLHKEILELNKQLSDVQVEVVN